MPTLDETIAFVRERTAPAPVPLAPELVLYQATELTPLWRATATELHAWDDSPYWAFPWAGGQALARHLLDRPELVRGRRVLDFATGSGLVAIAAARAGAARVVAVDVDPFCRAAVALNAALNRVEIAFEATDPLDAPLDAPPVAGADLVLAGDAGRVYAPREGFVELSVHDVPTTVEIEDAPVRRARVLEFQP